MDGFTKSSLSYDAHMLTGQSACPFPPPLFSSMERRVHNDPEAVESVESTASLTWPQATILSAPCGDEGIYAADSKEPDLVKPSIQAYQIRVDNLVAG